MAALPYMPLYVADYLADTAHLTALENGAYLMLIMNYWQRGKALPGGGAQLARIARVTVEEWEQIGGALEPFFEIIDGQWTHKRIEAELAKVHEKSVKASNAGKASAKRKASERSTSVEQTFNHTDTDTDTEIEEERDLSEKISDVPQPKPKKAKGEYPSPFETFWKAFPTDPGMSKSEAFKVWDRLAPADRDNAMHGIPGFKAWVSKQGKDYRTVHAVRYLSQRRFDGFDAVAQSQVAATVVVAEGSPAWAAWLKIRGKSPPTVDIRTEAGVVRGWRFPTEYPPQEGQAA